jgi:hypothetical protein
MVDVRIEGDSAIFEVEASHKLWALKSRITVPLTHIKAVHPDPNPAMGWFDAVKLGGTDMPHIFRAGTFWFHGDLAFFDVRHPENTIVVELENEHYARLIVEVEHPESVVHLLQQNMKS